MAVRLVGLRVARWGVLTVAQTVAQTVGRSVAPLAASMAVRLAARTVGWMADLKAGSSVGCSADLWVLR